MREFLGDIQRQLDGALASKLTRDHLERSPDDPAYWPAYRAYWQSIRKERDIAAAEGTRLSFKFIEDMEGQEKYLRTITALTRAGEHLEALEASNLMHAMAGRAASIGQYGIYYPDEEGLRWHIGWIYYGMKNLLALNRLDEAKWLSGQLAYEWGRPHEKLGPEKSPMLGAAFECRIQSLHALLIAYQGEPVVALEHVQAAMKNLLLELPENHPELLFAKSDKAHILRLLGDHHDAAELSAEVAEGFGKLYFFGETYYLALRNSFYRSMDILIEGETSAKEAAMDNLQLVLAQQRLKFPNHIDTFLMQRDFASAAYCYGLQLRRTTVDKAPIASARVKYRVDHPYLTSSRLRRSHAFLQIAKKHAAEAYKGMLLQEGFIEEGTVHPEVLLAHRVQAFCGINTESGARTVQVDEQDALPEIVFRRIF